MKMTVYFSSVTLICCSQPISFDGCFQMSFLVSPFIQSFSPNMILIMSAKFLTISKFKKIRDFGENMDMEWSRFTNPISIKLAVSM